MEIVNNMVKVGPEWHSVYAPEAKMEWVKEHERQKAEKKQAEALKPPVPPPAERRSTATGAPEPRKRSLDEVLNGGRVQPPSRLDLILSGKSTPVAKDASLTAAQLAAWDSLDALMDAGVTGDPLTAAVEAFAETLQAAN